MSVVTYNGISLPYPVNSSFTMERIYDESGTDPIYLKIEAMVQCVLGPDYFTMMASGILNSDDSIVDATRYIRNKLLQPRKALQITVGGNDLIPAKQAKDQGNAQRQVDAKHGPQPISCVITNLTEDTFLLTFRIVGHYWENYANAEDALTGANKDGNPVISCRWSDSQEVDGRNFTRRIREGMYVIRSDAVGGGAVGGGRLDNFRENFAVVGIPPGFVRKVASYRVDPNGLKMTFRLEDQELYLLPPFPAYEASGTYMETLAPNGSKRWAECMVELKGRKSTGVSESKYALINTAIAIVLKKMQTATGDSLSATKDGKTLLFHPIVIMEQMMVSTDLYDNTVKVSTRWQISSAASQSKAVAFESVNKGVIADWPLGSGGGQASPRVAVYGNPDVDSFLKAAAYFDPSLQQKLNAGTGQLTPTEPHGEPGTGG